MLRLMTKEGFSSALTTQELLLVVGALNPSLVVGEDLVRGLRPWKEIWVGERWLVWCLVTVDEMVGAENKAEEVAAIV